MGEGVVKNPEKLPTSFMDGPIIKVADVVHGWSHNNKARSKSAQEF